MYIVISGAEKNGKDQEQGGRGNVHQPHSYPFGSSGVRQASQSPEPKERAIHREVHPGGTDGGRQSDCKGAIRGSLSELIEQGEAHIAQVRSQIDFWKSILENFPDD